MYLCSIIWKDSCYLLVELVTRFVLGHFPQLLNMRLCPVLDVLSVSWWKWPLLFSVCSCMSLFLPRYLTRRTSLEICEGWLLFGLASRVIFCHVKSINHWFAYFLLKDKGQPVVIPASQMSICSSFVTPLTIWIVLLGFLENRTFSESHLGLLYDFWH